MNEQETKESDRSSIDFFPLILGMMGELVLGLYIPLRLLSSLENIAPLSDEGFLYIGVSVILLMTFLTSFLNNFKTIIKHIKNERREKIKNGKVKRRSKRL